MFSGVHSRQHLYELKISISGFRYFYFDNSVQASIIKQIIRSDQFFQFLWKFGHII